MKKIFYTVLLFGFLTAQIKIYGAGSKNIDVLHYHLSLDIFPEEERLNGDITVTGIFTGKPSKEISLDFFDNFEIESLLLNGAAAFYKTEARNILINSETVKDTFRIRIKYKGTPKRTGLSGFVFGEINRTSLVYNLNEPDNASSWFPCNDTPADKALFDIIISNDTSRMSLSNGKLVSVTQNENRKAFHWKTVYPMATYLAAVYSSNYLEIKDKYVSLDGKDTMPVNYYVLPKHYDKAKYDMEDHPQYLKVLSELFGEYPFIKEKYAVAVFLWNFGAMEHQTITGIGSNFISGRKFFSDIYVHEAAHHWWGNAVTPNSWNDIWLNEGFSTYSEALYAEKTAGWKALQSIMLSKFNDNFTGILYQPGNDLFSPLVYDKGGWVLHMLRWEVGDSVFFKILRTWYEQYKYKSASTEQFRGLCEKISGLELHKFFDQWIYTGEGHIKLDYTWEKDIENGNTNIELSFTQTQSGYAVYDFPLEISIKTSDGKDIRKVLRITQKESSFKFTIPAEVNNLELDPDNRLLASFIEKS